MMRERTPVLDWPYGVVPIASFSPPQSWCAALSRRDRPPEASTRHERAFGLMLAAFVAIASCAAQHRPRDDRGRHRHLARPGRTWSRSQQILKPLRSFVLIAVPIVHLRGKRDETPAH